MVLVTGGAYAEYVVAHVGCLMKIPQGISLIDAAGNNKMITKGIFKSYFN